MTDQESPEPVPAEPVPVDVVKIEARIPYRLILTIIWLSVASAIFLLLLYFLRTLLFHLLVAAFLALVMTPAISRLERLRVKRGRAIAIVVTGTFVAIIGLTTLIAAPLASEGVKFANQAPQYLDDAIAGKGRIGKLARQLHLQNKLKEASPGLSRRLSELSGQVLSFGRRIASAAFTATIVVILAIFMLVEGPRGVDWFLRQVPQRHRDRTRVVGRAVLKVVSGYTTGVLLLAFLNGAVAGLSMTLTGTQFVLPLAVWAAIIDILPIVGGLLSMIPAGLFAFVHSVPAGIIVLASILVYQQVKNHILYPVVVGRAVKLNSLLVLIAVLAGTELGHIAGAVLAIPIAGSLQVLVVELVKWRREVVAASAANAGAAV